MSEAMEALARRAMACPGWRWTEGMLAGGGGRIMEANGPRHRKTWHFLAAAWDGPELYVSEWENATTLPDLADPATLGCVADLVQAHLAGLADRDAAHYHGVGVASAWQDWFMGRTDRRAVVMVEALEVKP